MAQRPRGLFPGLTPETIRRITAARLRPVAEQLSRELQGPDYADHTPDDQGPLDVRLSVEDLVLLLNGLYKTGNVLQYPFLAGLQPTRIRPAEKRLMVHIQNQSGANQIAVGFGQPPALPGTIPCNGYIVSANLGWIEPPVVPDGELWVTASGANTPGLLLMALPQEG